MARIDSLHLLLSAEIPTDLPTIEAALRAIVERIDEVPTGSPAHTAVHARIDTLLTARERARAARPRPGGG